MTSRDEMIAHHRGLLAEYASLMTVLHALGAADPYTPRDNESAYQTAPLGDLALSISTLEMDIEYLRRVIATPSRLAVVQAEYAGRGRPRCHYCGVPTRGGHCDECGTVPATLRALLRRIHDHHRRQ